MRKAMIAGVATFALVGASFLPAASAAEGTVDNVDTVSTTGIGAAHGTIVMVDDPSPASLQGPPLPHLAQLMDKAKQDRENRVTETERQAAAERSGVEAPAISEAAISEFDRIQARLQGQAAPGEVTTESAVGGVVPHYFGPYGNYANSPQHLPTAIVTFGPPDPAGLGSRTAMGTAVVNDAGVVSGVTVTDPGAGYSSAPAVTFSGISGSGAEATAVINGTLDNLTVTNHGLGYSNPVVVFTGGGLPDGSPNHAAATATIDTNGVILDLTITRYGLGYTSAPTVTITSSPAATTEATVVATVSSAVASVTVTNGGSGYITPGIRKFVDGLPGLDAGAKNNLEQFIPVAVPDTDTYKGTDYYEIGLVQYREKMHSDLPATLLRGYVQLSTSLVPGAHVQLSNAQLTGPNEDIAGMFGVTAPHYLGPLIVAQKDRPVRVVFRNLLPTGVKGDLFLPVDTTVMGAGQGPNLTPSAGNNWGTGVAPSGPQNPECGQSSKPATCYLENRATIHLHGGATPWISDGTPHQWITPAGESTSYPQGVSVKMVPDMPVPAGGDSLPGQHDGVQTFYYTNQQSARMLFYHDHAWGITRLNVYAGEAAGYIIQDSTEEALVTAGTIPNAASTVPLIIEDKTFVPTTEELAVADPTWDTAKWGTKGNLWLPHVYVPAQNPWDTGGVNQFGRWAYGPWFHPATTGITFNPIPNPYRSTPGPCNPTSGVCDPEGYLQIPGTPNESMGMEAFADTPVVNGTAYPKVTLDPKSYRFRVLNAANDRFWNLSLYEASGTNCTPSTGAGCTEVALNPTEVLAAKTDPIAFPTPIANPGPDWVQIGTESGFLANPAVIPAQPITWVTDPTVFNAGNVDKHSLLLGPAERADVIVDFSQWAGKTLILYNDAPAAFPARDPRQDYYTDNADLRDTGGANTTPEGFGPNTRTVMQITIAGTTPAAAFNTTKLNKAFAATSLGGGGVFEKSQSPIVVGQSAYNTAYDTSFGTDTTIDPNDGFVRITNSMFTFNTLANASDRSAGATITVNLGPKALHDEMGASWDNMYGRMSGNLGLEAPNNQAGLAQNLVLYPYVNPATETFPTSINLPPGVTAVPIVTGTKSADCTPQPQVPLPQDPICPTDGTQIWKITHNGVDTHPIHFHFSDVQLINRVGWDGIIRPPDANEIGWKDTVRVSPLEDTIVALRPIVPQATFGIEKSQRLLNPALPLNSILGFVSVDARGNAIGNPTAPIQNKMTDFDWEYVWHCHILSHEEMDMMRPITVTVPATVPDASSLVAVGASTGPVALTWTDPTPTSLRTTMGNPKNEVGYRVYRTTAPVAADPVWSLLTPRLANATTYQDAGDAVNTYAYKVESWNAAGVRTSNFAIAGLPAPTGLVATPVSGTTSVGFTWAAPSPGTASGYRIQRSASPTGPWIDVTTDVAVLDPPTPMDASRSVPRGTWYFRVAAFWGAAPNQALGAYSATAGPVTVDPTTTAPVITTISPVNGAPGAKTDVTITGGNLTGTSSVTFGGLPATAIVVAPGGGSMTLKTPTHTAGVVDVVVTTPDGEATATNGFTFAAFSPPGVPRAVQGLRGVGLVAVSWAPPASDGGKAVTGYTATVYDLATNGTVQGSCTTTGALTCQVTGLTNQQTYYVQVYATNAAGVGLPSTPRVATTTATVPSKPQTVSVGSADSAATVAWIAPLNDGGSPVTGYVARAWDAASGGNQMGTCTTTGALTCGIGGLANGATYYIDVYATNLVGTGALSTPRVWVIPATPGSGGGSSGGSSSADPGTGASPGTPGTPTTPTTPTTPVTPKPPTTPVTPKPPTALPPWKFMPNPVVAEPMGGGVTMSSKSQAQTLSRVIMTSPPNAKASKAPIALVKKHKVTRVKIVGLPVTKRSTVAVKMRIDGVWKDLGLVRTNASGVIVLPALHFTKAGDYLVSMKVGSKTWYITIRVK